METQVSYGGFMIRPIVTATDSGRYTASAILTGPCDRSEHTVGAEIDYGRREEAVDRAIELAIAEIERRRYAPDAHVKG
jgi:dipeptidyl aminopeptidase/acylaminoacyl peptidase